ncbi:MAG TPA: cytidine deaminase [Opitutaceae bacterium]|jgi:cytidine deaminase
MTKISEGALRRLEKAARSAGARAYAPYSKFPVGAAVLGGSGKVYAGCNVENASFGLCNCAERTAVFTAIAAGEKAVRAVAVYTPTPLPTAPCGACRQVINEFGPDALVISVCDSKNRIETRLDALLPGAFGPGDLL